MKNNEIIEKIIKERRNVRTFSNKKVSKKITSKIIEMGIWAPNHRMTEPWRFRVIQKNSEKRLLISKKIEKYIKKNSNNSNSETVQKIADKVKTEFEACPLIIYVSSLVGKSEEETLENYSSTSIAIQNMSLYAWSVGIGIGWSTGKPIKVKELKKIIEVPNSSIIAGCLYMGYIEKKSVIIKKSRTNHLKKTIWN
jgi:nitroreductase